MSNVAVDVNGLPAAQPKVSNCDVAQANNPSVQGTVAAAITPCPTEVNASWNLSTESYPFHNGSNSVQVCASDFATLGEPNTTCSPAKTVNVDDSCAESSVGGGEVLSAQFAESNAETVTVPYGKGAEVTGQLADNAGDPVAGATLCVKMQTQDVEPSALPVGTVKTDANGNYAYKVPAGTGSQCDHRLPPQHLPGGAAGPLLLSRRTDAEGGATETHGRSPRSPLGPGAWAQSGRARRRPAGQRAGIETMDHLPPDDNRRPGIIQKQLQIFRDDENNDVSVPSTGASASGVPLGRRREPGGEGSCQRLSPQRGPAGGATPSCLHMPRARRGSISRWRGSAERLPWGEIQRV